VETVLAGKANARCGRRRKDAVSSSHQFKEQEFVIFLFHTLSASLSTLCNELRWGAKEETGGLEDVVALIHSFGSYRLCFLRILTGLSELSSRQSLLESRMG